MTDREIFRKNLIDMMNITRVKQIDIARYTGVSYQTVSAWVTGRGYPRADAMEQLCRFFGVRQSTLTEERDPEASQEDILMSAFRGLSDIGKEKMLERAAELLKLYPKGKKRNGKAEAEK